MPQEPPRRIPSSITNPPNPATFIFLHGYGDDADGWTNIASQFQSAHKLPHLTWLFPNAPLDQESMTTAWYTPTGFSPIPVGRSSSSSSSTLPSGGTGPDGATQGVLDEGEEEDSKGILKSVAYIETLIAAEISSGITPLSRIVLGGFSQGCAISLVLALSSSRYAGKLAGVVGLSGYLPLGKKIESEWKGDVDGGENEMRFFLAHGTKDQMVPVRMFREYVPRIERLVGAAGGGAEGVVEARTYEGLGHATSGGEFRDMCAFLERVVPE